MWGRTCCCRHAWISPTRAKSGAIEPELSGALGGAGSLFREDSTCTLEMHSNLCCSSTSVPSCLVYL